MSDPILESIEKELAASRILLESAYADESDARDALTMAGEEVQRRRLDIARFEQAKAALEGKSDVLTDAIKQVQTFVQPAAAPVQKPNANGINSGMNDWTKPSDKPRMAKLGEEDVVLEPGWTIGPNSFGEPALLAPGVVVIPMPEPAVPNKRSATSLGAGEFESDLPEMGGETPIRTASRSGIEDLK